MQRPWCKNELDVLMSEGQTDLENDRPGSDQARVDRQW